MLSRFNLAYKELQPYEDDSLVTKDWLGWNRGIHSELLGATDFNYIKVPSILNTMYGSPDLIMRSVAPKLTELLKERDDSADFLTALYPATSGGAEQVMYGDVLTTPDLVCKAYQWLRFITTLKLDMLKVKTIVEVGGGYGAMALFLKRLLPDLTYYFVETPTMGAVAYQYLQDSLPEVVCFSQGTMVKPAVNIVASSLAGNIPHDADIFISQGALCETPTKMIDLVADNVWFGAKQGMLILWTHDYLMNRLSQGHRIITEPFDPWPGQNHVYFYTPVKSRVKKVME